MPANNNSSPFEQLCQDVCQSGMKILLKKDLRDMLGRQRSGPWVNKDISYELQRRGIVHYPTALPMAQGSIVMLAIRGSPNEKLLDEFVKHCRATAIMSPHIDQGSLSTN